MVNVPFDDDASDGTPEEIHGSLETPQDHAREIVRCLELLQADFEMTLDEACALIYSFEDELRASDTELVVEDDFLSRPCPVETKRGSRKFLQTFLRTPGSSLWLGRRMPPTCPRKRTRTPSLCMRLSV